MTKREALSLLDIAPRHEMVEISEEQSLRVTGISSGDILELLTRFPPIQGLVVGAGITRESIVALGPDIIAALCAAATGELGNEEVEKFAKTLPIETQLDIIDAMRRVTFSRGFGPFAQRLAAIASQLFGQVGKAPVTNSPPLSQPLEEQPTPTSGD